MQEKMKWFFGTKNPQKGSYYNGYVAERNERNKICIKKFQIPRIEFAILIMYEDINGRQIFSMYPKPNDDVYHLNKLRENEHDEILLGVRKPKKERPYNGYIVKAKGNGITMRKYSSAPLKEIIMPGVSLFNCNKQFFICFDVYGKKHLIEIV